MYIYIYTYIYTYLCTYIYTWLKNRNISPMSNHTIGPNPIELRVGNDWQPYSQQEFQFQVPALLTASASA